MVILWVKVWKTKHVFNSETIPSIPVLFAAYDSIDLHEQIRNSFFSIWALFILGHIKLNKSDKKNALFSQIIRLKINKETYEKNEIRIWRSRYCEHNAIGPTFVVLLVKKVVALRN